MKNRTWMILIGAVLLLSVGLSVLVFLPGKEATQAEIRLDGKVYKTLDLRVDQQVRVETEDGYNIVTVENGKIAVTDASCPDHHCMNRGFCSGGTPIVCLPNRLVISFLDGEEIDGAVG